MADRLILRTSVRSLYDLQKLRIQMGNRIVGNFKAKIGQAPDEKEDTLDPESQALLREIRAGAPVSKQATVIAARQGEPGPAGRVQEEPDLTDVLDEDTGAPEDAGDPLKGPKKAKKDPMAPKVEALVLRQYNQATEKRKNFPKKGDFKGNPVISTYTELCLIGEYVDILRAEQSGFRRLEETLEDFPIWTEFLVKIKGIGAQMGAVIVSELDPHKADHVSAFWKFCGLHVRQDVPGGPAGRTGASKRDEHLVMKEYQDKNGKTQTRKSVDYSPWVRVKLVGVMGSSFLRTGPGCPYERIYRDKRHFYENHPVYGVHNDGKPCLDPEGRQIGKWTITNPGRRHRMATRAMVKLFLMDLWLKWRALEGLPVTPSYHEGKLGHKHGGDQTQSR